MILNYFKKNFVINLIFIFLIFSLDRISKIYIIYLNKKYYEDIMNLIEHDETKLIYGIAFNIIFEYFEFRIIEH